VKSEEVKVNNEKKYLILKEDFYKKNIGLFSL
jgi:hypothetical protein